MTFAWLGQKATDQLERENVKFYLRTRGADERPAPQAGADPASLGSRPLPLWPVRRTRPRGDR